MATLMVLSRGALGVSIFLVLSLGVFLRVHQLENIPGINGDEAFPTVQMREMTRGNPVHLWVPTQRILSPVYAALVLGVQFFSPEFKFLNVRLPALIAGLLLLFSSYFLLKDCLSKRIALFTFFFIASFPMAIAYSRSAVEQSLMGVVGIVCLHFALRGLWKSTLTAYAIGLLVHPVNVFLMPLLIAPLITKISKKNMLGIFLLFTLAVVGLLATLPPEYGYLNLLSVAQYLLSEPLSALKDFAMFLLYYSRLFSGVTTFEYFSNPTPNAWTRFIDPLVAGAISLLFFFGIRKLVRTQRHFELAVAVGLILSILCFFIAAGPRGLAPGLSRHANFLTVPSAVCFAILIDALWDHRKAEMATAFVALALLFHFWIFYFVSIKQDGGGFTHRTYLTGLVEPKNAVFDWIEKKQGDSPVTILVEDWWTYWPIRYLALAHKNYSVLDASTIAPEKLQSLDHFIAVGSPGGPLNQIFTELELKKKLAREEQFAAAAYGGKPALMAWKFNRYRSKPASQ